MALDDDVALRDVEIPAPSQTPELWCVGKNSPTGIAWCLLDRQGPWEDKKVRLYLRPDSGPYRLTVRLIPPQGSNVTFHLTDPVWHSDQTCPQAPEKSSDQIFDIKPGPLAVSFINANSNPDTDRLVRYALQFSAGRPFDPIFRNGGGR